MFNKFNNKDYYLPKHNAYLQPINDSEPPSGVGFFDTFIHGQTMNIYMPPHPQTLLYVTGAT